ncbi:MAG: RNA 2',3'-cyclic phosphodiesterase [Candidatus Xenobia bacterium]
MPEGVLRTFIAVHPEPGLVDRILARVEPLRAVAPHVRWLGPQTLHYTLMFLGSTAADRVDAIAQAMRNACTGHGPFDLHVRGLGAFPNTRRPRIIWVGAAQGAEALCHLQAAVAGAVAPLGFPQEDRAFVPHLTLARVKEPRPHPPLEQALAADAEIPFGVTRIERISLLRSILHPKGAQYSHLIDVPLA